jgi:23S rRNA G2069 N7-methylase RlmK/C1962 C5-methylase RlmI
MHPFRGTVTNSQADLQAEMLANRVFKKFNQLWPRFKAKNTGVFRLYDQDIPEIRMLVDAYVTEEEGLHLVLAEYEREQTKHLGDWLERMAQAVGKKLELEPSCLHLKTRRTRPESGERHTGSTGPERLYTVREGSLKFRVDLDSFIDTGLFGDHRKTRALFAKE